METKLKNKTTGIYFCFDQTAMSLHKDLITSVFLELDQGCDMLNFSEICRRCHQIFLQQIKVMHKPETDHEYEEARMENSQGQQHGTCCRWYSNGKLRCKHNHFQDRRHGIFHDWWPNGQLWCEHNYIQGQYHGISRVWNALGELIYKYNYYHGSLIENQND